LTASKIISAKKFFVALKATEQLTRCNLPTN